MRLLAALVALVAILGCAPSREVVFFIKNDSTDPQAVIVGTAAHRTEVRGASAPSIIPPGTRLQVTLSVPDDEGWALYVEPSGHGQPLILGYSFSGDTMC